MKRISLIMFVLTLLWGGIAFAHEDVLKQKSCPLCGMDRGMFAHSRMVIEYDDGSSFGACSLHCAAVELAVKIDKTPKRILVADYGTHRLIDAESAHWTIGGTKNGVMTKRAKWAFLTREDADKFIAANGGALTGFEQAMKSSYEDMYLDTAMIREKRKKMKMHHSH